MSRYLKAQQRLIDTAIDGTADRRRGRKPDQAALQQARSGAGKRGKKPAG